MIRNRIYRFLCGFGAGLMLPIAVHSAQDEKKS